MRNIFLKIAYDGTRYIGWQRQPQWRGESIQGVLEQALKKVLYEEVSLLGAGRTDAGVHAYGQQAAFFTEKPIPIEQLPYAMKCLLPPDIVVLEAKEMPLDFHARFNAKGKCYRYTMICGKPDMFNWRYAYFHRKKLDYEAMAEGAKLFCGSHDFRAFTVNNRRVVENYVRQIDACTFSKIEKADNGLLPWDQARDAWVLEIRGEGFLYKMVRLITASLFALGQGKITLEQLKSALEGQKKTLAAPMPPQGLVLLEVYY